MNMKDNGSGEIVQSKITLFESHQFSGIFQLLVVSLQHKCSQNYGLCGKKVVFESLLFQIRPLFQINHGREVTIKNDA